MSSMEPRGKTEKKCTSEDYKCVYAIYGSVMGVTIVSHAAV